jgi:hypothetical protein
MMYLSTVLLQSHSECYVLRMQLGRQAWRVMVVMMSKVKFDAIQRQLAEAASQRESHKRQREHCKEQLADFEQMLIEARDRSATAIEKKLLDILEAHAENG